MLEPCSRVRFIAARGVHFWVGMVFWSSVGAYLVISSVVVELIDHWWWLAGAALLVVMAATFFAAARSRVVIEGGAVRVRDGFRSSALRADEVEEFVIVESVAFLVAPLVLYTFGPFEPDRLGIHRRDGSVQRLQWCFADHDEIRIIRKRLNRALDDDQMSVEASGRGLDA